MRRFVSFATKIYDTRPYRSATRDNWHGLARYQIAAGTLYDDEIVAFHESQYAKVSTIYEGGDSIDLTYYAEIAGYVPEHLQEKVRAASSSVRASAGNGDSAPEWGVDIHLNGGTFTYGPWADRQR